VLLVGDGMNLGLHLSFDITYTTGKEYEEKQRKLTVGKLMQQMARLPAHSVK
jgi:hypothetical protein